MQTSLSLAGKKSYNTLNISGKSINIENTSCLSMNEIKNLKFKILNDIIIPFISKKWDTLNQNLLCINNIKKKLDYFYKIYQNTDLLIYKEILNVFDLINVKNNELENLEKKMYSNGNNEVTSYIYKTTMIKLKPEYEIYDLIFGRPNIKNNEVYNKNIIDDISILLSNENTNFDKIKKSITQKYKIKENTNI